ncbi:MAG: hypothetical protein QXX30_04205 [Candidatus Aenigmatarchaeota archaeon]
MKSKAHKKCPNCGNFTLEFILGEWVCHECEYHTKNLRNRKKGTFR